MADSAMEEEIDLDNCSAEELIFRIQLANAEREQAEIVALAEADNFTAKQLSLEGELRDNTGMEPVEFEEFLKHLPESVSMPDAIKPLKGTAGQKPQYAGAQPEPEPLEYLDGIASEVKQAAIKLREAKAKEEMLVEEVVELKKVRNRLFGDNEGTVSGTLEPVPGMLSDPVHELSIEEVLLLNGSRMCGVENLLSLNPICEATVAESLHTRFGGQQIYSSIDGESLVVTNPNAWLPSSSRAMAAFYNGKSFLAPHINSQAQALLAGIRSDGRNRSVFLKGESGAGKSTALGHMLEFFEVMMPEGSVVSKVKHGQKVLAAFTNCLSEHTDNSSRASLSMELQLGPQQQLLGCCFSLAGLELARVTECSPGQRSFHALHYVANGTTPPEQDALHFQPDESFVWLTQNGVSRIPGVDDEAAYHELKQSLLALEFSAKERAYLLRMISLVLNLGNLQFSKNQSTKSLTVGPSHTLEACATMLRCDVPALAEALTAGCGEALAASRARDSFGRVLYSRLVQWVVRRLNQSLCCDCQVVNVLTVVDPAGFENSTEGAGNGFDQLVRNYAQERLGGIGELLVYARTEADFAREGVEQELPGPRASEVLELFEKEDTGLIALLQKTELAPIELVAAASGLESSKIYTNKRKPNCFTVRHSCGDVEYDTTAFRRLSSTQPSEPILELLKRSLCSFVKGELFAAEMPHSEEGGLPVYAQWKVPSSALAHTKFQLDAIARALQPSEPRFTFCVRPNETAHPTELNLMVLVREMRSSGLVSYLEFLSTALVWRVPFKDFAAQFHCLYPDGHEPAEHDVRANCELLLNTHLTHIERAQFGKTRVYLARSEYQQMCTALYQVQATQAAAVQAVARAALARGDCNKPVLHSYNPKSSAWEPDLAASVYDCEFDKLRQASTALGPVLKGWVARSVDRSRAEAEAELAMHANTQPEQAAAELEAAAMEEWEPSQKQQQQLLAQSAVEQAKELLDKFDVPDKEGPLIMGTAFSDLADPETNLVTRERWNSHFGKDNFDKYDEDQSGVMDKAEWDTAFQSYASDFLSQRIEMFYEGELKTVQKEIEDKSLEEQEMHFNTQAMAAEDNYLKLLEEAQMRKVQLPPHVENRMMAEEDKRGFQVSAISKAEQALQRLATLDSINQQADSEAASGQAGAPAVDPSVLGQLVDSMVAQTKGEIDSGAKISPEKKQQQQRQMDNIHWQRVEERIMERENRKMIEMGAKLDSPEARSSIAEEIEAEARESELVLQAEMNNLLEMFGSPTRFRQDRSKYDDEMVAVSGEGSPAPRRPPYKGKYGFKYKHNKLETMSIHE